MKTAISVPDNIFSLADKVAKKLKLSRSELYTQALQEFLEMHQNDEVTAALDRLYGEEPSLVDPHLDRMQRASLSKEDW